MENDIINEVSEGTIQKKKSILPVIGIVAALLLLFIVIAFGILNSPKVLMGILIGKTPDTIRDAMAVQSDEQPLYVT